MKWCPQGITKFRDGSKNLATIGHETYLTQPYLLYGMILAGDGKASSWHRHPLAWPRACNEQEPCNEYEVDERLLNPSQRGVGCDGTPGAVTGFCSLVIGDATSKAKAAP
jgi:hypothetical protein